MAHSEKCPVCKGEGLIHHTSTTVDCYGCGGRGWVTVQDPQGYNIKSPWGR